ncbi:type I-E CRISPR-associated protein Cse2/CasB [Falsiroseomonas sp. CW058]|uniref:type I-E CRISPR-associated protein Cse2/CasB n=1 Tax=Falsiroseomonas sp. CW058 TaxID=3388664 RepID=UPI003D310A5D
MIRNPGGALAWWAALTPDPAAGRKGDRAALARLRRCATVEEAMIEPATIDLYRRCGADDPADLVAVALAAAVLAHLRADAGGPPVARQLGPDQPDKPETAILKPLRFRRLLEATTAEEGLPAFRRLLALADGKVNATDLARALLDWTNPHRAAEVKRRWTFAYWNADPAPNADSSPNTDAPKGHAA